MSDQKCECGPRHLLDPSDVRFVSAARGDDYAVRITYTHVKCDGVVTVTPKHARQIGFEVPDGVVDAAKAAKRKPRKPGWEQMACPVCGIRRAVPNEVASRFQGWCKTCRAAAQSEDPPSAEDKLAGLASLMQQAPRS